jgi:hypothetical protein
MPMVQLSKIRFFTHVRLILARLYVRTFLVQLLSMLCPGNHLNLWSRFV